MNTCINNIIQVKNENFASPLERPSSLFMVIILLLEVKHYCWHYYRLVLPVFELADGIIYIFLLDIFLLSIMFVRFIHLGCFQMKVIYIVLVWAFLHMFLAAHMDTFLLDIYLGVLCICEALVNTADIPMCIYQFTFPPMVYESSCFPTCSLNVVSF